MSSILNAGLAGAAIGASVASLYAGAVAVQKLAEQNIFVTFVDEGSAKAFIRNGQFQKMEIALKDHCFVQDLKQIDDMDQYLAGMLPGLDDEKKLSHAKRLKHPWLIIKPDPDDLPDNPSREGTGKGELGLKVKLKSTSNSVFGGIKWVGIYPFAQIHRYWFRWSRIKQKITTEKEAASESPKAEEQIQLVVKTTEEPLDYILVRDYTYTGIVSGVETKGGIPVDILFVLTIQIENPYKALFNTFQWLRTIMDQVGAYIRDHAGNFTYDQIIDKKFDTKELSRQLKDPLFEIRAEYGAHIKQVQIQGIEPASELATKFRDVTTRKKVAEIDAKVVLIGAKAEEKRINRVYGAIDNSQNGAAIKIAEEIGGSSLTTLATGGLIPALNIGDGERNSPKSPKQPDTEKE